jgi:tetratricopeptide (TPR) repeat protein
MQIKLYHILIFICVIISATVLVFPDRHFIIQKLIESGRLEIARKYIKKFTTENPDDALLFIMSSNSYLLEGKSDKAIETLKPFLYRDNVSKDVLLRLAQLYEWERNPRMALIVLERTSQVFPDDLHTWYRLISYYRYLGQIQNEARAIVQISRLNHQIKQKDNILAIIDKKMFEISELYQKSPDQMSTFLLSKIHVTRSNYADEIADKDISIKTKREAAEYALTRIIELYVYADLLDEIKSFTCKIDKLLHAKMKYCFVLMNVMRWADLDTEAVAFLWELHEKNPNQKEIIEYIVKISRENGELLTAIDALQKLIQIRPNDHTYGNQLAQLLIESEKYRDAILTYKQLMYRFPDQDYAALLLKTATNSGQKELMLQAVDIVQGISSKPPELLKQLVEIYLGLEKIQLAYDVGMQYLKTLPNPEKDFVKKMLEIAIWSNNPKNIHLATSIIQNHFPDDTDLSLLCADAYLAVNQPKDAFLCYGRVVHLMSDDRDFMLKYMDIASYTQIPEMMSSAALTAAKLSQKDYAIVEKSIQLLQWTNQPRKAYDILEQFLESNGGTSLMAHKLLTLARESGDPNKIKKAMHIVKNHVPRDPNMYLTIAQEATASGLTHDAVLAYESYLRHKAQDTQVQRKLAELYVWDGQTEKAFDLYKQLFEIFPKDTIIRQKLIEIAGWTKNASAIAYLVADKANAEPSDYSLQVKAGDAAIAAGQTKESTVFFERALTIRPDNIDIRRKLALYYGWLEQYDDRIRVLESIQKYGPLTQSERIQIAQAAMDKKQPDRVISLLTPLFKRQLLSETSGILLAQAFQQKGQNAKSIQIYNQLAQQYNDNPKLLSKMGNQILWMQNMEMALSFFKKALSNDPANLDALKGSGQVFAWKNDSHKAIQFFQKYLKINPDDYEVRYQLAELFYANGQQQYAFRHYQKALTLIVRQKKQYR